MNPMIRRNGILGFATLAGTRDSRLPSHKAATAVSHQSIRNESNRTGSVHGHHPMQR
jgi:hypothetical protein